MSTLKQKKPITIILFGRTGVGKSSLANEIMGKLRFSVGHSLTSQTDAVASETFTWPLDPSIQVKIIDTPGFADNRPDMPNRVLLLKILDFLKNLEDGLHIAVFCLSAKTRIDRHDTQELEMLGLLLGKEMFDHICIAVTQANTLVPDQRKKVCESFVNDLPMIFMQNNLPPFTEDRVLFADFDRLQEGFLEPLTNMIRTTSSYIPQLAEGIDLENSQSIDIFLARPETKEAMAYYEKLIAEQKEQMGEMQQMIFQQAEDIKEQARWNQEEQEKSCQKIAMVYQQLENQQNQNEEIRKQYERYVEQERKKLEDLQKSLDKMSLQNDHYKQMEEKNRAEISALNAKIVEVQNARAPQPQIVYRDRGGCNIF